MYTWVRAATVTITDLLREHIAADVNLGARFDSEDSGTMVVSASTPQEMIGNSLVGLSVWLYQISRDDQLLNHPPRRVGFNQLERRRLPLRLHYLMTPIADGNTDGTGPPIEQAIIGKVLQVFHDHPLLSGAILRDDLVGSGAEIAVRLEPLNLEEITRVWDALEKPYQLCISYEVSVVMLASDEEARRITPVDVVEPEYGVITQVDAAS